MISESGARLAESPRAHEVEPDVAVAEPEPVLAAQARRRLERVPRLVGPPPATLGVDEPGERVEQAVEVRRDVEPEDLEVVADVADDGELAGLEDAGEAAREAGAAAAAREEDDPHAGRRGARASGPEPRREALEVGVRVDVGLELGDGDRRERRMSAEAFGAPGAVERREDAGIGQRERVRRAVGSLDEREPGVGEPRSAADVARGRSAFTTSACPSTS